MRLDADLGIDSIKRVEILSALQEQLPDAPVIKPEHLGILQTLGQIVEFLAAGGSRLAQPALSARTPALTPRGARETSRGSASAARPDAHAVSTSAGRASRSGCGPEVRSGSAATDGDGLAVALADRLRARGYDARVLGRAEIGGPVTHRRGSMGCAAGSRLGR